jgi:general secretion pathway protein L
MSNLERSIRDFFRWWGNELAFLVPEPLKLVFNENKGEFIIHPEGDFIRIVYVLNGNEEKIGVFELNELGKAEYISFAEADSRSEHSNFVIRLSKQDAIEKIIFLPSAAAEGDLHQVVSYELDKLTPFRTEQVYFAARRIDERGSEHQIKVQLVIAPREKLDTVCKELRGWGLMPTVADFAGAPNNFKKDLEIYNLLPEWARAQDHMLAQVANYAVYGLLLILFVAALAVPVWREARAVEQLKDEISIVSREASQVQNLRNEIEQRQEKTARLLTKKTSSASIVEMLEKLSKLIANDTWLKHLRYSDGKLQIQGQSPTASSLISVLEGAKMFNSVRFVSPVTQDRRTGLERFQISAEIAKGEKNASATR